MGVLLQAIGFNGLYIFDGQRVFLRYLSNIAVVILLKVWYGDGERLGQELGCDQLRAGIVRNTAFQSIRGPVLGFFGELEYPSLDSAIRSGLRGNVDIIFLERTLRNADREEVGAQFDWLS